MSVFYHNDDPLLRQPPVTFFQNNGNATPNNVNDTYAQLYKQQLMVEMQQQQQNMSPKDWLGDLDNTMKGLDNETVELLNQNNDFTYLHTQLQALIQNELMLLVKYKINANEGAIDNIKKQLNIMQSMSKQVKDQEKQNLNDLNDYMKNYSHLTFDEYRRLKNGEPSPEVVSTSKNNKKTKINEQ
jgi:hypothetical protein